MGESLEDGIEVARITIVRRVYDDDIVDDLSCVDSNGDRLDVSEALGMLVLAQDAVLHPKDGRR